MDNDIMLEGLYDQLIKNLQTYHPAANENGIIRKAFEVAKKAHEGQMRKSGEPFVIHPIKVAIILSELHLDKESLIAALLHDVVEDTALTKEDIRDLFGEEVMFLVDGVTKITKISENVTKAEMKLESFRICVPYNFSVRKNRLRLRQRRWIFILRLRNVWEFRF